MNAPQPETKETLLLSVDETARELNLCRKTVENLIKAAKLKSVRIGRRVLVRRSDLIAFIRQQTA